MNVYRPLRAGLFFYECLRLLLLLVSIFTASMRSGAYAGDGLGAGGFPHIAYMSSNVLFVLITLFVWLRPEQYWNYLNLYMAGKITTLVTFYLWQFFYTQEFLRAENPVVSAFLVWSSVIVSLADMLSLWGAWTLKNIFRRVLVKPLDSAGGTESGGQ